MALIIPMIKYILNGRKNKLVIQKALNQIDSKPFVKMWLDCIRMNIQVLDLN